MDARARSARARVSYVCVYRAGAASDRFFAALCARTVYCYYGNVKFTSYYNRGGGRGRVGGSHRPLSLDLDVDRYL